MITEQEINKAAIEKGVFTHGNKPTEGRVHFRVGFIEGTNWMKEQTESSFRNFIQQTELSQKDKDFVKGVFFDWLTKT